MNILRNIVASRSLTLTNLYGIPFRLSFPREGDPRVFQYEALPPSKPQTLKIMSGMYGETARKSLELLSREEVKGSHKGSFGQLVSFVLFSDDLKAADNWGMLVFPKAEKQDFRDFVVSVMSDSPMVVLKSKWNALDDGSKKRPASDLLTGVERKTDFLYCDDVRPMPDHPHLVFGTQALWRAPLDLGMSGMTEAQADYFRSVMKSCGVGY